MSDELKWTSTVLTEQGMTRDELASVMETQAQLEQPRTIRLLTDAAVELRKTCDKCRFFDSNGWCLAFIQTPLPVPQDGTGFCHRWKAKP